MKFILLVSLLLATMFTLLIDLVQAQSEAPPDCYIGNTKKKDVIPGMILESESSVVYRNPIFPDGLWIFVNGSIFDVSLLELRYLIELYCGGMTYEEIHEIMDQFSLLLQTIEQNPNIEMYTEYPETEESWSHGVKLPSELDLPPIGSESSTDNAISPWRKVLLNTPRSFTQPNDTIRFAYFANMDSIFSLVENLYSQYNKERRRVCHLGDKERKDTVPAVLFVSDTRLKFRNSIFPTGLYFEIVDFVEGPLENLRSNVSSFCGPMADKVLVETLNQITLLREIIKETPMIPTDDKDWTKAIILPSDIEPRFVNENRQTVEQENTSNIEEKYAEDDFIETSHEIANPSLGQLDVSEEPVEITVTELVVERQRRSAPTVYTVQGTRVSDLHARKFRKLQSPIRTVTLVRKHQVHSY